MPAKEDSANYAKLVDALPNTQIAAPVYEQESRPETRDLYTLAMMFRNTSKHINIRLLIQKACRILFKWRKLLPVASKT